MSAIADEIRAAMSGLAAGTADVRARFAFGPDFIGFQGHFPGRPILPGVCNIHAALLLLEAHLHRKVKLREIERARFLAPTTCNEQLDFHCSMKEGEKGEIVVRTTVTRGDDKVARFRLRVAIEGADR